MPGAELKSPLGRGMSSRGILSHEIRGEGADTGKQEGGGASLDNC